MFQLLDSFPYQSGLLFLSESVGDFRTLVFELCLWKGGLGLGDHPLLRTAWCPQFCSFLQTLIGLDFVEGFPMATQKLAVYFLKLILYAIWHYRDMKHYEKVACTAQSAISLIEFSYKQTCSKKFEFWQRELRVSKFRKHWYIGEAFCRVDCLDHLVFTFS